MGTLSPGAACPLPSAAPASLSARASRVPAACVCSQELASSLDPPGGRCPMFCFLKVENQWIFSMSYIVFQNMIF